MTNRCVKMKYKKAIVDMFLMHTDNLNKSIVQNSGFISMLHHMRMVLLYN
jgi:hypothetical protein